MQTSGAHEAATDPDMAREQRLTRGEALPPLVLVGALSRAGKAIARHWPGEVVPIHRQDAPGIRVADYRLPPANVIPAGAVVLNCVGSPRGSNTTLLEVNRDVPRAWADAAAAAGAAGFVQLSSLSVYGRSDWIDGGTGTRPTSAYGATKLAADCDLLERESGKLAITSVRIPILFGDETGKLATLVRAVTKVGILPALSPAPQRSMLSYDALACAVLSLARDGARGVVHVGDPTLFTYELLAQRLEQTTGRTLRWLKPPRLVTAGLNALAPSLAARLLASSVIAPSLAYDFPFPPSAGLVAQLDRLIAREVETSNAAKAQRDGRGDERSHP